MYIWEPIYKISFTKYIKTIEGYVNEVAERSDAKGVTVVIDYVYGETNHGVLGWNMGYNEWSLFY